MSINNVINNYEIKKEEQIRKDYITKSLNIIANQLKYRQYKWISYDEFLTNEKNVINDINNNITINALNELINAVNNLDLDNSDNHLNEENNNNKENVNENDHEDEEEIEISSLNNSDENEIGIDNNNISNNIKEVDNDIMDENEEYKIPNLYSRILEDGRFIKYKELINDLIKEKSYKRKNIDTDLEDIILSQKEKQKKISKRLITF